MYETKSVSFFRLEETQFHYLRSDLISKIHLIGPVLLSLSLGLIQTTRLGLCIVLIETPNGICMIEQSHHANSFTCFEPSSMMLREFSGDKVLEAPFESEETK